MNKQQFVVLMVAATFTAFLAGCEKSPEVCPRLSSITEAQKEDPAFLAELKKKCPEEAAAIQFRAGKFQPSPVRSY